MDDPEWAVGVTAAGATTKGQWARLRPLDWRVLRLAADQRHQGAGTLGLATALGVTEEEVIESGRRLELAGFIELVDNDR